MRKILFLASAMLLAGILPSVGEAEFKSQLSGNELISRLRYSSDNIRLSLISFMDKGRLENLEAAFISPFFSAGQLELKGLPRELSNPEGIGPGASVLTENSGLRVTDAISGTSRTGIILEPDCGADIWMYRTNSGNYCTGVLFDSPLLNMAETEMMMGVGTVPSEGGSSWFSDCPVMPRQFVFNGAAEIRMVPGVDTAGSSSSAAGRKMLKPGDSFNAAVSMLGGASFPQYTAPAGFFRLMLGAGNNSLNLSGLCQYAESGYLPPEGPAADYGLSAGVNISTLLKNHKNPARRPAEFRFSAGYFFQREHPGALPSRLIGQKQSADAGIAITAANCKIDICSKLELMHLPAGTVEKELSADAAFTADIKPVLFGIDGGIKLDDAGEYSADYSYDFGINCKVYAGNFKIEADCSFMDHQEILTAGFDYRNELYVITASIEITEGEISGLTAGFES